MGARQMADRLRFRVAGMDCASCAEVIRTGVARLPGVSDISISTTAETLTLSVADPSGAGQVDRVVRELGYVPALLAGPKASAGAHRPGRGPAGATGKAEHDHAGHDHDHAGHDHAGHDHDHAGHDHAGHDHDHAGHAHAHAGNAADGGDDHGAPLEGPWWLSRKGQVAIASGGLIAAGFAAGFLAPIAGYALSLAGGVVAGIPVALHAFRALRHGSFFTIQMLMVVAAVGAVAIGAAEEAAIVLFLFAVGELLEGIAAGRARAGIRSLASIAPKSAQLETPDGTVETPIDRIAVGDVVVVRAGDRVPADGRVLSGTSSVDEAALTGESIPKVKTAGDAILAGSINQEATLRVAVEKPATETLISRVVRMVEEATESKAPSERFIDRFSRYYMPAICILALAVVLIPPLFFAQAWDTWVYRGLTLLLIGCPCALVISTPAAIASALAAGARQGILVKGGATMEAIGRVKSIAFDKTGTLTAGKPAVCDVRPLGTVTADEILRLAAAAAENSSHPLSVATLAHARSRGLPVTPASSSEALPGKGVTAVVGGRRVLVGAAGRLELDAATVAASGALEREGKSVSAVVVDGVAVGLLAFRDEPRADAREALDDIRSLGLRTVMLTGDNRASGEAIGRALGLDTRSELLTEAKVAAIRELAAHGGVAKVGDGINDAPALAAATVGIAMGSGTDVALEAGDAAILRNRLTDIAALIRLSRQTMAVVTQNVAIALGLKAVFLVTTVAGFTGLWIAVLADTGATVVVTANALRLLRTATPNPPA